MGNESNGTWFINGILMRFNVVSIGITKYVVYDWDLMENDWNIYGRLWDDHVI